MDNLIWLVIGVVIGSATITIFERWRSSRRPAHPVAETTQRATSPAKPSLTNQHSILVPIVGNCYAEAGLRVGLEIARNSGKPLHAVVYLEVPRTHTLETDMSDKMEEALKLLEKAEIQANRVGVTLSTEIIKTRSYTQGIIESVQCQNTGLVVLQPSRCHQATLAPTTAEWAEAIQRKTSANVILLNPVLSKLAAHNTLLEVART